MKGFISLKDSDFGNLLWLQIIWWEYDNGIGMVADIMVLISPIMMKSDF